MESSLRILHIEDNKNDAELIWETLSDEGFRCHVTRVDNKHDFLKELDKDRYDLILCDYNLPSFNGKNVLELAVEKKPDIPFVFVSGTIGETRAIETLKQGATDYVLKDDLRRLVPVVRRALRESEDRQLRQRTERDLEHSHHQLKYLFDNLDEVFFSLDAINNTLVHGSPSHETVYGYPLAEFYKNPRLWYDVIVPQDKPVVDTAHEQLRMGKPAQHQHRIVRADGALRWLEAKVKPTLDSNGTLIRIDGIISDITDKKNAEEELLLQTTYFQQLFENSPEGIALLDEYDRVKQINKALETMFQFSPDELRGKSLNEFIIPFERLAEAKRLTDESNNGRSLQKDTVRKRKDGTLLHTITISFPIMIKDRRVGACAIYVDISEYKRLEAQFYQTQRLESIGTLAGGIAHDFNNILAIILGHASLLDQFQRDRTKYLESVQAITRATDRGTRMVKQLLAFARKSESVVENVSINSVVLELEKLLKDTFPKAIRFEINLNPYGVSVMGDSNQIHQVLLNLCVNARDSMPKGGTITIATSIVPGTRLQNLHPDAQEREYILLQVSDSGTGMNEETRTKIFEPFFTTKAPGKGTGLGLAVVFGIMQSHKGFIDVESQPDEGTTFSLYFPVHSKSLMNPEPVIQDQKTSLQGTETILLIDDEQMLRDLLGALLTERGYKIIQASDGKEAVNTYRQHAHEISVVLCDLDLPYLDGYEVLKQIQSSNPGVKFILASGYVDSVMRKEALLTGVADVIQKPYMPDKLINVIRTTIDK